MKKLLATIMLAIMAIMPLAGCKATLGNNQGAVATARQKLETLPEPTFESLEVYTHDLSAKGVEMIVNKYPDTKVPLRVFAESSLSILENQQATMLDLIAISDSLDQIKEGKVKAYLDIAWTLLELNGVIRRNDIAANLTVREQRLVIALCKGIKLGTDPTEHRDAVLNSYGPRYGPATKKSG